ncbi:MAG TPA: TIGR01777 family oxidoreductase [Motiliproteus sp.]
MNKSQPELQLVITGASGFIGSALVTQLLADGNRIVALSRTPAVLRKRFPALEVVDSLDQISADRHIDAIINLAGAPILDARWSEKRKALLRNSRLHTTEAVVRLIQRLERRPEVLISGSAIGFYGSHDSDRVLLEQDDGHSGFTHELCRDWEQTAQRAEALGVRVCLLRTGVVLGAGGALARMLLPFRLGLGGPIGNGRQWMSWIHLDDMVALIRFLLVQQVLAGVFNATAPEPVTNTVFTRTLGRVLKRPTVLPMPAWVLRLALGEGATLLTEGQRVIPGRVREAGFAFQYPALEGALAAILKT